MNRETPEARAARARRQGGFTLIETVMAMLIMLIVGLGAAALFLYSVNNNTGAGDRAMALAVAQQRLELLRRLPYNDAALNATTGTTETVQNAGRSFQLRTTVQNAAGTCTGCAAMKIVTIEVWTPSGVGPSVASHPVRVRILRPAHNNGPYARS